MQAEKGFVYHELSCGRRFESIRVWQIDVVTIGYYSEQCFLQAQDM